MPLVNQPTDRKSFTQYCLRRLGQGIIDINVSEEQVSDRINDALIFWWDFALDGSERAYYKYQITSDDYHNHYIVLPDNIIGAVKIFPLGDGLNTDNMFDIRYQIALNDLYTLTSFSVVPYYMAMEHLALLEYILVGKKAIRYNRYDNQLHIDANWHNDGFTPGTWLIVDCYQIVDPDALATAYTDRLLAKYATALIKRQWGENIKLYGGVQMLGGVQFNGQQIWNEAQAEIDKIEQDVIHNYSKPVQDLIG